MQTEAIKFLTNELQSINTQLWEVEDDLRKLEATECFDEKFVCLARSVYKLNDQRAILKRSINKACGSSLMEEKSYGNNN